MDEILSSQGDSTLMFTMDTTGSMSQEIKAAKAIAKQIISATRDFEVDYILSPFNDPSKPSINPFSTNVPLLYPLKKHKTTFFLYPLKTSENLRFSGV